MPFKRSRMGNSSTLFASDGSLPVIQSQQPPPSLTSGQQAPYNPKKVVKQADAATIDQSRRTINVLSTPPVQQEEINDAGLEFESTGGLSQRCYYCSVKFSPTMDMFMYRGLAFCKDECRKSQIKVDIKTVC